MEAHTQLHTQEHTSTLWRLTEDPFRCTGKTLNMGTSKRRGLENDVTGKLKINYQDITQN